VSPHDGEIQARQMDIVSAGTLAVDRTIIAAVASDYNASLLPGGTVNPDTLRLVEDAIQ
jgi:protease I